MTTWAKDNTDRRSEFLASAVPSLASVAFPSYYGNASPTDPRPHKLTLLPLGDARAATMFGQKRMDEATLAALRAQLPADVRVEDVAAAPEEQKAAWKRLAVDVFAEVEVKESTGPHGEREITVSVADDVERNRQVAFVRQLADGARIALYLTTPAAFERLYRDNPPELPPGEFLRTADAKLNQSFNPFFVIVLTPLVVWLFARAKAVGKDISTARKMFIGMLITTAAVLIMAMAGWVSHEGALKVSWGWLAGFYFVVTIGELCLSPMALSLVTKVSPKRFVGLTMGGWFFATAVGNKFSGFLGGLQTQMPPTGFFLTIAGACALVAGFLFLVLPSLDAALKKYSA
jgi:hypothetical protein